MSHAILKSLTVGLLAATFGFAAAQAQETGPRRPGDRIVHETLRILDLNGDGVVGADEVADEQRRLFTAIDVNGDGAISVDEFRRNGRLLLVLNVTTFFDMMDTNGDRQLDSLEVTLPAKRWVTRYDADGDGTLSTEEIRAARLGISN